MTIKGILRDFFATGPQKSLMELEKELHQRIKMKSPIHLDGEKRTQLKRTREIFNDGIFITPRAKYITTCTYIHGDVKDSAKLNEVNTKLYRAGVGIVPFLLELPHHLV